MKRILDRIFVVLGAFIFIQAPLFIEQYQLQLKGHVDELSHQVEVMRQVATESKKSLEQFIQKFVADPDVDFSRQGQSMSEMVKRWRSLTDSMVALNKASVWIKPLVFITYLDYSIAKSTFYSYQFGLILTYEGLIYALIGMVVGYLLYSAISNRLAFLFMRRKNVCKSSK